MDQETLKRLVQEDIKRFKSLNLAILPGKIFYKKAAVMSLYLYALVIGLPFLYLLGQIHMDDYLWLLLAFSFIFCILGLFFLPKITRYITFTETIKPHLKLGNLIERKLQLHFTIFASFYAAWVSILSFLFEPTEFIDLGNLIVFGYILGLFVSMIFFEMELSRIGLSLLIRTMYPKPEIKHDE